MVKSRFPGKPGKYFHKRKSTSIQSNQDYEGFKTAEDIYHRLSVFNALFGDENDCSNGEDEVSSFHGFSPHEIQVATKKHKDKVKTYKRHLQERGAKEENSKLAASVSTTKVFPRDLKFNKSNKTINHKLLPESSEQSCSKLNLKDYTESETLESNRDPGTSESNITGNDNNVKINVNSSTVSGTFILPSRSAHSSRVIKPNKRFIQSECSSSPPKKQRLVLRADGSREFCENLSSEVGLNKTDQKRSCTIYAQSRQNSEEDNVRKIKKGLQSPAKVILRKPRLKIKSQSYGVVEGPFSSSTTTTLGSEGHPSLSAKVVCGVCGSVRLYKFLRQARKFGILSCEPCRRFILRIVKLEKQKTLQTFSCNSGNGTCQIRYSALESSVTFSTELSQKKNEGDGPRRCQGCWLHLCLKSFKMPPDLQNRLSAYLPKILANKSPPYSSIPGGKWGNVSGLASLSTSPLTCLGPGRSLSYEVAKCIKRKATAIARRDTTPMGHKITGLNSGLIVEKDVKKVRSRQKLPAPGPRVKHVCRSASLVLGQPTATFVSSNKTVNESKKTKSEEVVPYSKQNCRNGENNEGNSRVLRGNSVEVPPTQEENCKQKAEIIEPPVARMLQDLGRVNWELLDGIEKAESILQHAKVSIDFWESYDPEEVAQTGFSLLGYGSFQLRAVCFLCGSAGHDKLVHCASCCEPYHTYCVSNLRIKVKDWWKINWLCPRCTHCEACSKTGGAQVTCTKCHKSFHTACITTARFNMTDVNWLCPSCLCCKSCNNKRVHVFIGNLPLCKTCYRLRKKGSFCPLCQRCYDDNDYSTKMMECAQCKSWIHAACEGLSNEKYQVLSFLPSSIEFICRLCCKDPPALWSLAVDAELRAGYLNVLKALSKNRSACALLKTSPQKKNVCVCRDSHRTPIHLPNLTEQSVTGSLGKGKSEMTSMGIGSTLDDKNSDFGLLTPKMTKDDEESLKTVKSDFLNLVNEKHSENEKEKISVKECSVVIKNIPEDSISSKNIDNDDPQLLSIAFRIDGKIPLSPQATSLCDSGIGSIDEEQKSSIDDQIEIRDVLNEKPCLCDAYNSAKSSLNLMLIKSRVTSDEYSSLLQFHQDMEQVLGDMRGGDILKSYHKALKQAFPWFDPKESQICESLQESLNDVPENIVEEHRVCDINDIVEKKESKGLEECFKGLLDRDEDYYYCGLKIKDLRSCMLCKLPGEGLPTKEERLLYCGNNEWVHANCALWSSEVFEEIDGSLQNVHSAISRARLIRCFGCNKKGASVGCCARSCPVAYHFNCALSEHCVFLENKEVYCKNHSHLTESKELHRETDFPISRCIYVELDHRKKKDVPRNDVKLLIGSLYVESFGNIVPEYSDDEEILIPCEFKCTRLYWSTVEPWRIVQYHIKTKVNLMSEYCCENDINYTVDHSLDFTPPPSPEDSLLTNNSVEKKVNERDIKTVIGQILDAVCSKEEENNFTDQQANDLLPPEIKDVIFEDLPHDLLDGISMHDIFPKMTFDDLVSASDSKSEKSESYSGDTECTNSEPIMKKLKLDEEETSKNSLNITKTYSSGSFKSQQSSCNAHLKTYCKLRSSTKLKEVKETGRQSDLENLRFRNKENKWKSKGLLQVDGTIDCSESESNDSCDMKSNNIISFTANEGTGNEFTPGLNSISTNTNMSFLNVIESEDRPVKCSRCHRTYRTSVSYNRHLTTCNSDFLSCSESDSSEEEKCTPSNSVVTNSLKHNDKANFPSNSCLNGSNRTLFPTTSIANSSFPNGLMYSDPQSGISKELTESKPTCSRMQKVPSHGNTERNVVLISVPENQSNHQSHLSDNNMSAITAPTVLACNGKPVITNHIQEQIVQPTQSQQPMVEIQTPSSSNPAIFVQQVHTDNLLPTFIDPYQQSAQPSIQYVAAIDSQEKTQYLASTPLVPGAFHIQSPPVVQNVPTLLGTIIQPNGVEQLVVNTSNPGMEVYNPQQNSVLITNTPVYVGMETVVSNTVMSSSQFFSSSIPGMLAASSYSATTTQVFQATKPIIDIPQSYVVLNTNPSIINHVENSSHCLPQIITNTPVQQQQTQPWGSYQVNFQEAYKVDKSTSYQTVTRQIICEEKEIDGVKMINSTQETIVIEPLGSIKNTHGVGKSKKESEGPVKELSKLVSQISTPRSGNNVDQTQNSQLKCNSVKLVELPKSSAIHKEKPQQAVAPVVVKKVQAIEQLESSFKKTELFLPSEKVVHGESGPKISIKKKKEICDKLKLTVPKDIPKNLPKPPSPPRENQKTIISISNGKSLEKNGNISSTLVEATTLAKAEGKKTFRPLSNKNKIQNKAFHSENPQAKTKIKEEPKITYEITSEDGFSYTTSDVLEAWQKVFESVQAAREGKGLPPLSQNPFSSPDSMLKKMMGLGCNSMKYVLEQLPGVGRCIKYKPVYHRKELSALDYELTRSTVQNPSGCARTEPYNRRNHKYDMFSWLASRHRRPPKLLSSDTDILNGNSRRATSSNLPMAMRFRHLKETSKQAVGVFRSDIHGRGLFCLRDIESGEMVIEYAGELIRSALTDLRERYYTSKGIGCYMFRIDDRFVVDATMKGNAARFINHSCEPNCYSRVVDILGKKHILIFALRRIPQGEELTYDYKFPLEDDKINCHCLSRKCRKYLN